MATCDTAAAKPKCVRQSEATNGYDLGHCATLVNDTANAFANYFATKATGMVGTDVAILKTPSNLLTSEEKDPKRHQNLSQVNISLTCSDLAP